MINKLVTIAVSLFLVSGALAAQDATDPKFALASFLSAVHDLDGERIWSCLSTPYRADLNNSVTEMRSNGDLSYYAQTWKVPEVMTCTDAHQMIIVAMSKIPTSNAYIYQQMKEQFSLQRVFFLVNNTQYQEEGSALRAYLPDKLGSVVLIREGAYWKVADASDFFILRY
jgi:hypothetical protein